MLQRIDRKTERLRQQTAGVRKDIATLIQRHTAGQPGIFTPFPGVMMAELHEPMPPMAHVYEPSLSLVIQGEKNVTVGETVYTYNESYFFLTAINLPTVSEVPAVSADAPFLSLLIGLDLGLAREVITDMELRGGRVSQPSAGMALGEANARLLDAVRRYLANAELPEHERQYINDLTLREIFYLILIGDAGSVFRETVVAGTSGQRVSVAIGWLRDNYLQPLKVEELARMAGMGVSTLHHHFRRMTSLSPLQYQKRLRLHEARRLLVAEEGDAASVAIRVGYESVTQFHREYKRMFGVTPIQDKEQLLKGAGYPAFGVK